MPLSGDDVDVDVNAGGPDLVLRAYQFLTDWWPQSLLACVILAWCVRRYGFWSTLDFLFKQAVIEDTNADAAAPTENDGTGLQDDVGDPGPTNTAHGGDHTCNFQNNGNGNLTILQGVTVFEDSRFIRAVSLNPVEVPDETATAQELVESPVHTNCPGPAPQGPAPTAMPRLPPPGPRLLLPSAPNDETTI